MTLFNILFSNIFVSLLLVMYTIFICVCVCLKYKLEAKQVGVVNMSTTFYMTCTMTFRFLSYWNLLLLKSSLS